MASTLTTDDVRRVAELARLELSDDEQELFARQLAVILAYAEQIQALDTTDVPPTAHAHVSPAAWRADEPRPSLPRSDALANAPDPASPEGLFRVPKVIE